MLSLRENLPKIGISPGTPFLYRECWLPPLSFRALIRSMSAPASDSWSEIVAGPQLDKNWTQEGQGCAWGHERWFITSNDEDRRSLHIVDGPSGKKIKSWSLTAVPPASVPGFKFFHFGHLIINGEDIFIDHWFDNCSQLLVLKGDGAAISYSHWILLDNVDDKRVGLLAINFDQQYIITSHGTKSISEVFLHRMDGTFTERRMPLTPPITDSGYAQGGIWSPNNHLYISSGRRNIGHDYQYIYYYSPLNGALLGRIAVPAFTQLVQELEGICYAEVERENQPVQIHAVLLEKEPMEANDDIFLKSFSTTTPDLI